MKTSTENPEFLEVCKQCRTASQQTIYPTQHNDHMCSIRKCEWCDATVWVCESADNSNK